MSGSTYSNYGFPYNYYNPYGTSQQIGMSRSGWVFALMSHPRFPSECVPLPGIFRGHAELSQCPDVPSRPLRWHVHLLLRLLRHIHCHGTGLCRIGGTAKTTGNGSTCTLWTILQSKTGMSAMQIPDDYVKYSAFVSAGSYSYYGSGWNSITNVSGRCSGWWNRQALLTANYVSPTAGLEHSQQW